MAQVTFIRKEHLGSGNFEWTYRCTCYDGGSSIIKVTSGNENEAKALAELDCDEACGEAKASSLRGDYAQATRGLFTGAPSSNAFICWVNEVVDDAYIVSLCSGDEIVVAREIVKSFRVLGRSSSEGLSGRTNVSARLEIDAEVPGALAVIQLARALERQLGSAAAAVDLTKDGEVCQQVAVQVSGMACHQAFGYYTSAYPLTGALLARTENCAVTNVTRVGQSLVRFVHTGMPGTPCSNNYNGKVYLDVCWIQ